VDDVGSNKGTRLLNAWSPQNPNSDIPALTTVDSNAESRFSSYYVENGSYSEIEGFTAWLQSSENVLNNTRLPISEFTSAHRIF
jgi:hypothetical protein